tara:strand:+ start:3558 stop:4829 length:1272 start_codon:yes stop_codon:yes gene_type:complete
MKSIPFFLISILILFFTYENFLKPKTEEQIRFEKHQKPYMQEIKFKTKSHKINYKITEKKLGENLLLKKYTLTNGFYSGISGKRPGGYIDFHQNNTIILSSRGILGYSKNLENNRGFSQITNNLNDFLGIKQFYKNAGFSFKDLLIYKDKIFVSYTEEIKTDCWNTSLLFGEMNYSDIQFRKLFISDQCIHSIDNIDKDFGLWQSGGRISIYDNENILLSIGDYGERYLAQDIESINGKIIMLNIENSSYEIISMGHRNPQGLFFDKDKKLIIETEHGPYGGDEINLIKYNKFKGIPNFGWPVVSTGEHYCKVRKEKNCDEIYLKYPLHKSHMDYGFNEPLKSFVPSIGISQIEKVDQRYVVSSMGSDRLGDKSIYFFHLDDNYKIYNFEQIKIGERIRDLKIKNGNIYMFFENPPAIGLLKL